MWAVKLRFFASLFSLSFYQSIVCTFLLDAISMCVCVMFSSSAMPFFIRSTAYTMSTDTVHTPNWSRKRRLSILLLVRLEYKQAKDIRWGRNVKLN
jgi:hypothetical protein